MYGLGQCEQALHSNTSSHLLSQDPAWSQSFAQVCSLSPKLCNRICRTLFFRVWSVFGWFISFFYTSTSCDIPVNEITLAETGKIGLHQATTASKKYLTAPDRFPRSDWQHKFLVTGLKPRSCSVFPKQMLSWQWHNLSLARHQQRWKIQWYIWIYHSHLALYVSVRWNVAYVCRDYS